MRTRLATEIRRLLKATELQQKLNSVSLADLEAVERLLERRAGVRRVGAPSKYSDEFLTAVFNDTRREMQRLRDNGNKRAGAKTAIRNVVDQVLMADTGTPVLRKETVVRYVFNAFEAARKRG